MARRKKFFTSSKRQSISEIDCYNYGDLGHLAHQCPKPPKDKYKNRTRARKINQVIKKKKRRRISHTRRRMTKK
jgi:hypothetical protein